MFEVERDIFHNLIKKDFQELMSFYYDDKKTSSWKSFSKFLQLSARLILSKIKSFFKISREIPNTNELLKRPYWFYINSKNNRHAVEFIYKHFGNDSIYVTYDSADFEQNKVTLKELSSYKPSLKSVFFILYLFVNPEYSSRKWERVFNTFQLHQFYRELLAVYKPKAIFFSNDHIPNSRALMLAANFFNIKTIYLQHATVNDHFPPLKFSLSLLDGEHSLETYKAVGLISGEVRCLGIPRMQILEKHIVESKEIRRVGIAFNMRDSVERIDELIKAIASSYPDITLVIRKHPRETREINFQTDINLELSDSVTESSSEYIKKLDMLIANNSSILLEAAMLNVYPLQYNLSLGEQTDSYGYIRHKVVNEAETIDDLIASMKLPDNREPSYFRQKAKFYDASIGTEYQFDVQAEAIKVIDEFINGSLVRAPQKTLS